MRCYICDASDNLDGAEIRMDRKTHKPMCSECFTQSFEALKEFGYDDELGRPVFLEVGRLEKDPRKTRQRQVVSAKPE